MNAGQEESALTTHTAYVESTRYQSLKGWGLFPSYHFRDWGSTGTAAHMFGRTAIQDAVYALKPDIIRVELRHNMRDAATGGIDLVRYADLVDQIQMGWNRGVRKYIMSTWSPPDEFKVWDPSTTTGGNLANGCNDANNNKV